MTLFDLKETLNCFEYVETRVFKFHDSAEKNLNKMIWVIKDLFSHPDIVEPILPITLPFYPTNIDAPGPFVLERAV